MAQVVGTLVAARSVSVATADTTMLPPTDLNLGSGEALVIRGRNGAGKSTLLKVLAGMVVPSSGSVSVAGMPVSRRSCIFRTRVASMIGLPPMASDLTVQDHVELVAATWSGAAGDARSAASEILESLRVDHLAHRYPHELSTGQLQLAGLSMVLVRPFDLLLLDEPEQRLDSDRLVVMCDVLARRRDNGASLIIATHSSVLVDRLADNVLDLDVGR